MLCKKSQIILMNIGHFQYLGPMGKPKKQDRTTNLTGSTNERPGTDHVITGPMRGLKKNCTQWRTQTHRRTWQLYDQLGPEGPSW